MTLIELWPFSLTVNRVDKVNGRCKIKRRSGPLSSRIRRMWAVQDRKTTEGTRDLTDPVTVMNQTNMTGLQGEEGIVVMEVHHLG